MYGYVSLRGGPLGEVTEAKLAIVSCPPCSYLRDGECVVCMDGEPHPACNGCEDGDLVWYRRPLVASIATAVVVSLIATIIVSKVTRRFSLVT